MDKNNKTAAPKPAGIPKKDAPEAFREMTEDAPEAFREMTEKGTTQAKQTYDKIDAATTEAADLIKNSYSKAVKGMQDHSNKIIEFAHANTNAAFDFVQKLSGVTSPTAFVELWTEHARKQLETLTEQTKQLAALAQKATLATAAPLKTGVSNPFNIASSMPGRSQLIERSRQIAEELGAPAPE